MNLPHSSNIQSSEAIYILFLVDLVQVIRGELARMLMMLGWMDVQFWALQLLSGDKLSLLSSNLIDYSLE